MNILMMIPGFFILSGIAVLLMRLLRVRFGEGMFLAVSVVVGLPFSKWKDWNLFLWTSDFGGAGCRWSLLESDR